MNPSAGCVKTVVRILDSHLHRHPLLTRFPVTKSDSDGEYEIFIDLEALDCIGNVVEVEAYHRVDDLMQAWKIVETLRPGSIHYMTVNISYILPVYTGSCVMFPDFLPYSGDVDEIRRLFSSDNAKHSSALQGEVLKTVSGCLKELLIEKTLQDGDIVIIHLDGKDDYRLVLFPDLYEIYKKMILREDYLEYIGIPQECYLSGDSSETMIFVKTINIPISSNELDGVTREQ